ncbi:SEC14 domain and spectrin repeat-containing protein 1-B-like [Amphibalanus amphitrite]|uniref:SEC14 domain and spectrin repeat-containing protein 1-B-like n=1 Tax=Amphibalanus amphitrite TaxID=1232801 RepID=UPI001C919B81|nr:SEC14 domain and spectrin repeat-containing protein 1-B-like [Amphibalanus amphitrite]
MWASELLGALLGRPASLPGSRDLTGRPVLFVGVPADGGLWSEQELQQVVRYLADIPRPADSPLCVVLDARAGSWRSVRAVQRTLAAISGRTGVQLVLRHDSFWEKQRVTCGRPEDDVQPEYIPLSKLQRYIAPDQIPEELGGTFPYNHEDWIQDRMRLEQFLQDAGAALDALKTVWLRLLPAEAAPAAQLRETIGTAGPLYRAALDTAEGVIHTGEELLSSLRPSSEPGLQRRSSGRPPDPDPRTRTRTPPDSDPRTRTPPDPDPLNQRQQVQQRVTDLTSHCDLVRHAWSELHTALGRADLHRLLVRRVDDVIGWVLGPGEELLASQALIGRDVASSERLIELHDEAELQCRDTYAEFAAVRRLLEEAADGRSAETASAEEAASLAGQRRYMESVCRALASRLERRRHLLITAARFYRLLEQVSDTCHVLLEAADEGVQSLQPDQLADKLRRMQTVADDTERTYAELSRTGEKLQDMLTLPVKNSAGQDITPDYSSELAHVTRLSQRLQQHVQTVLETWEISRLRLQQTLQLGQCQAQAEQALSWLADLSRLLGSEHARVGRDNTEIQLMKRQHQSFEETAKRTYEYGAESCAAAGRLGGDEVSGQLSGRLEEAWSRLRAAAQEHITRLRVAAVFHRTADEQLRRLRQLCCEPPRPARASSVASSPRSSPSSASSDAVGSQLGERETLLRDVGRTIRLGKLLRERLQDDVKPSESERNAGARAAISAKLSEVGFLWARLDAQCRQWRRAAGDSPDSGPVMESSPVSRQVLGAAGAQERAPATGTGRDEEGPDCALHRSASWRSTDSDWLTAQSSEYGSAEGATGAAAAAAGSLASLEELVTAPLAGSGSLEHGDGDSSPESQQDTEPPSLGEDWSYDSPPDTADLSLPGWAAWRSKSRTPSLEKLLDEDFPPLPPLGAGFSGRRSSSAGSRDSGGASGSAETRSPAAMTPAVTCDDGLPSSSAGDREPSSEADSSEGQPRRPRSRRAAGRDWW